MQSTDNVQSFISFGHEYSPPRSRTTAASIWAPQPQLLDSTWPKAIDSFSRDAERELQRSGRVPNGRNFFVPGNGSEDVFGPVGLVGMPRKRDIGAIGDGRKKQSPDFDDSHVEQLLRALNLNSPALYTQQPSRPQIPDSKNVSPGSPDFSPSSTVSALLTPTDLSPAKTSFDLKINPPHELAPSHSTLSPSSLLFDHGSPLRAHDFMSHNVHQRFSSVPSSNLMPPSPLPYFEQSSENSSPALGSQQFYDSAFAHLSHPELSRGSWRQPQQLSAPPEWLRVEEKLGSDFPSGVTVGEDPLRTSPSQPSFPPRQNGVHTHEASIFLQQKLKVADLEERHKIVDAICARGFEMMSHRGRVVDLATNCYGCHVLQKALDCEEDIRLLIVSELLLGDPALTLVNKHASHVWSKIMELTWTAPAPPIFAFVNKSLKGKWASLACHETGSLVVQHAFENLEESAKDGIIDELLNQGPTVFGEIAKNQWGSYCIQHILEHGSSKHRQMCLDHIMSDLLDYATNEQGYKSVTKALKETGPETLDRIVKRMCEPAKGGRRAMIVDLALSVTGSQLIASTLPQADKDQRTTLYDCIRGHIVTLRGCKTGSKVIWLL
ncbi:ARM repeat-containing protein [Suillus brevipes Sb2]|nr:ARM repeat-containing protein [Suillus brevipes Sb2]